MQNQLNNTLIDVRKAYRLLFDYQDRIKNLVSFIGGHFDFNFGEGYPVFSANAKSGKSVKLENWAWDWLSMYFYHFKFNEKDNLRFSIFILTDSGYYNAGEDNINTSSKIKPETFNSVEKSETKLFLVLGEKMWRNDTSFKEWESILFQEQKVFKNESGGKLLFKDYRLDQFLDEQNAIFSLKDFQQFCNQNGIDLKLKERELQ